MSLIVSQLQSLVVCIAVTGALAYWFLSWRRSRTPSLLAMVKALAALDLALLLGLDLGMGSWLFGIAALPNYLVHVFALLAAYWLQLFVLHLAHPAADVQARARVRTRILIVTQVALLVFFILGPAHGDKTAIDGSTGNPVLAVLYLAVFEVYLGIAMFDVFHVARHARQLPRGYLRLGLRLLRWGGIAGLAFVVEKALYSFAVALGFPSDLAFSINGVIAGLLTTVSILLLMAGVTVPAVGPRNRMRRDHRDMEPLWRDLTTYAPEVKFPGRPTRRADISDRVRQRITEINDVLVGPLQPYLDPAVYSAVLQSANRDAGHMTASAATAQAATIATALTSADPVVTEKPVTFSSANTEDFRDEASWLANVATAYAQLTGSLKEPSTHVANHAF
ncbi:MAB_1171c family putative transporter [Amycolatopsis sp. PS_44_ISF1]|uniref:MAB_1171c family putative transporter n=1 Tax=Amycolatopsis sp. PS_44_ISF1 TaxID=2974917 RepID=UPI0028DEECB2|nr:MAB_1171c family putative transporter [Amycolatopsis sp. PS_44_ISF1]MDT8910919.1 hypothetical protein [Amycolatopsis sp. PS_44_ISF1]